jgi:hypothetical protein
MDRGARPGARGYRVGVLLRLRARLARARLPRCAGCSALVDIPEFEFRDLPCCSLDCWSMVAATMW